MQKRHHYIAIKPADMKIYSADLISPEGALFSVRYIGTEFEIATWLANGLMPANACEVLELIGLDADILPLGMFSSDGVIH